MLVNYLAGRPVMSRCGARNFPLADASRNFDRCHSVFSLLLPQAALKNVPTSISLHISYIAARHFCPTRVLYHIFQENAIPISNIFQ